MTREAPVRVAEWPPLGHGGTPSIYGKAQSHCRSTIQIQKDKLDVFRNNNFNFRIALGVI